MITGSNIDRKKSPRRVLSFPCKVGSNHAFIESPSNCVKLDANILNGSSSSGLHNLGGISLQGLNQFAMDFDLHPSLLPQSLLFEIFEDVITGSSTKFRSNSSSSSDGRSPSQSACRVSPDASWNSSSRKVQSPAADQVEPLLSLAQVRISYSHTHSLSQFHIHPLTHLLSHLSMHTHSHILSCSSPLPLSIAIYQSITASLCQVRLTLLLLLLIILNDITNDSSFYHTKL